MPRCGLRLRPLVAALWCAGLKRRLRSPERDEVPRERFEHPLFADFAADHALLADTEWPDIDRIAPLQDGMRFTAQSPELLADGLHYELRIARRGEISTRERNWHDLFNALVWRRYPELKRALNARQVADIERVGPRERTRGQCALTLFDEGGVVVLMRGGEMLDSWDRHEWTRLFGDDVEGWEQEARVFVFGHALMEHALDPRRLLVAKALVVSTAEDPRDDGVAVRALTLLAESISNGVLLNDPQELRPLPVSGLPGWEHPELAPGPLRAAFLRDAECFRPLPQGRRYPAPLRLPLRI